MKDGCKRWRGVARTASSVRATLGLTRYFSSAYPAGDDAKSAQNFAKDESKHSEEMEWFCALRRDPARFYANSGHFLEAGFQDIPVSIGTQIADPFPIAAGDADWIFFEEVPAGSDKGRISCLRVPGTGEAFAEPEVVLECDTHISYPCIFRNGTDFFMIPESCASLDVRLYRATRFPYRWQLESILIDDAALTDTTPIYLDGHWYFFTTTATPVQQTMLFTAAKLGDRLERHPCGIVSSSLRNTRSAGHLFRQGGRLFRPAQDCVIRYGFGIVINEVTRLTPSEFAERSVDYIAPGWRSDLLGTHTLNSTSRVEVIDGRRLAKVNPS